MAENEQFSGVSIDGVRRELDAKIEQKISHKVFFSVLGFVVLIGIAAISYAVSQINSADDKLNHLDEKIAILQVKLNELTHKLP